MNQPLAAGLAVALVSLAAVIGPALGLSPWWITLFTALALGGLSLDAASYGGRGGPCVGVGPARWPGPTAPHRHP